MKKDFPGENWKAIVFDKKFTNENSIEVSNFGRIRTFNKNSDGNILNGSMINGYRILRLKLFTARDPQMEKKFAHIQKQIAKLAAKIKEQKLNGESKKIIAETTETWNALKKRLSTEIASDVKKRTTHYHTLIHRVVAEIFCKKPSKGHSVVAHVDFNKLNNRYDNLKWMTPEENYAHQQHSPYVIKEKKERRETKKTNSAATKLTVTKVMLLKKLLNKNRPIHKLAKQFKVSDTQILRIKRGENWGEIPAAT